MMNIRNSIFLCCLLILTACDGGMFGDSKSSSHKLVGERINIIAFDTQLKTSSNLSSETVLIPEPQINHSWTLSEAIQGLGNSSNEDLVLADNLNSYVQYKIKSTNQEINKILPVIVGDKIYQLFQGNLFAYQIDGKNIKLNWKKQIYTQEDKNELFGGGVSYSENNLFITYGGKDIVCLDTENGQEKWRYTLPNYTRSTPVVHSHKVLVPLSDNKIYALSSQKGDLSWVYQDNPKSLRVFGAPTVAVSKNLVIVPFSSGKVVFLDVANGNIVMDKDLVNSKFALTGNNFTDLNHTPIVSKDTVFLLNSQGIISAINLVNGNQNWETNLTGCKNFWISGNYIFANIDDKQIVAISAKSGQIKWIKDITDLKKKNKIFGPMVVNKKLLLVMSDGSLIFLDSQDGKIIDKLHSAVDNVDYFPQIVDQKLFLIGNNDKLFVLGKP